MLYQRFRKLHSTIHIYLGNEWNICLWKKPASVGTFSSNGWSNTNIFYDWLKHFINILHSSKYHHICLILGNQKSYIFLPINNLDKENRIDFISLPLQTSHPLHLVFLGPLKTALNEYYVTWMRTNAGKRITINEIKDLFGKACNIGKAVNWFKSAGIFPYDNKVMICLYIDS